MDRSARSLRVSGAQIAVVVVGDCRSAATAAAAECVITVVSGRRPRAVAAVIGGDVVVGLVRAHAGHADVAYARGLHDGHIAVTRWLHEMEPPLRRSRQHSSDDRAQGDR